MSYLLAGLLMLAIAATLLGSYRAQAPPPVPATTLPSPSVTSSSALSVWLGPVLALVKGLVQMLNG